MIMMDMKRYRKCNTMYDRNISSTDNTVSQVFEEYPSRDCYPSNKKQLMTKSVKVGKDFPFSLKDDECQKLRSSSVASYSSGTESSVDLSPTIFPFPPENHAMTLSYYDHGLSIPQTSVFTNTPKRTESTIVDIKKDYEIDIANQSLTNIDFFKSVDPLQKKLSDASVRLQSLLGNYTNCEIEHSNVFQELKSSFLPNIEGFATALSIIPKVLTSTSSSPNRNFIEIGTASNKYKICQTSFEKAVSKYSIKDAAVALVECDMFLSKMEKLESTIGRVSSSACTGKKLQPLDPAKLSALYHIIADKTRMTNIQRTNDCSASSPNYLTSKEQKMVREALSQYFNQLRQRQKRKRSNPDYNCNIPS